jgi:hypothetical protein
LQGGLATVPAIGLESFITSSDTLQGNIAGVTAAGLQSRIITRDTIQGLLSELPVSGLQGTIISSDVLLGNIINVEAGGLEAELIARDVFQGLLAAVDALGLQATLETISFGQLTTDLVYLYDHATRDASFSYDAWSTNHLDIMNDPVFGSSGKNFGDYVEVFGENIIATDDYLALPSTDSEYGNLKPGTNDGHISQWFYINTPVTGFQSLAVMGAGNSLDPGFATTVRNDGALWFMFSDGTARPQRSVSGVTAGTWMHQFGSVDRDGNLVNKRNLTNTAQVSAAGSNGVDVTAVNDFFLGSGFQQLADNRQAQSLYHLRLLNSAEETYIYNSGAGRTTAEILTFNE